jgi:hypothetical protein
MYSVFHSGNVRNRGGSRACAVDPGVLHSLQALRRGIVRPPVYQAASGNQENECEDQSADDVVLQSAALIRPDNQVPERTRRF